MSKEQSPDLELEATTLVSVRLANIELDLSVIRPNGLFPPELIVLLLQYADIPTCARASSSCKLWFETVQSVYRDKYVSRYFMPNIANDTMDVNWKAEFFKQRISEINLRKGLWWAEEQMSTHYPSYDFFGYVSSFSGNKMILNAHSIHQTSYMDEKLFEGGYLIDLDTMKKEKVPYGTIFANGYTVQTLVRNEQRFFSWKEFVVSNGSNSYNIKCKSTIIESPASWERKYHRLLVNMNGSPQVLIYTFGERSDVSSEADIEVYDLTTGNLMAETRATVSSVKAFFGDYLVVLIDIGLALINVHSNDRLDIPGNRRSRVYSANNILAISHESSITFYDGLTMKVLREIDWAKILSENGINIEGNNNRRASVLAMAFDKWKLVLAVSTNVTFYAIIDLGTLNLIQTIYNANWYNPGGFHIHLAPNGKIVTDCTNLTVYDFTHPNINATASVALFKRGKKAQVVPVKALELRKYALIRFNTTFDHIQTEVFYSADENGDKYRVTLIADGKSERITYYDDGPIIKFLIPWTRRAKRRNVLRLTTTEVNSIKHATGDNNPHVSWGKMSEVIGVFERKDKLTRRWEFCEPKWI